MKSGGERLVGRLELGRLSQSPAGCWRKCPSLHHVPNKQLADLRSLSPMFASILGFCFYWGSNCRNYRRQDIEV